MSSHPIHRRRSTCRICDSQEMELFLSLGPMPLANAFLRSELEIGSEQKYPLDVVFCRSCGLVQLVDVIDPEILFRDYLYVTGTSETIAQHNREYAGTVAEMLDLSRGERVVEVGSNDGSLLRYFQSLGAEVLGIDPAVEIAERARERGIPTLNRFFNHETAREIHESHGSARAVLANNVLAHVDETREFIESLALLLAEDGLLLIEVPYLGDLLDRLEFDTIYHEHLCYFSVGTLLRLVEQVGLSVVRMDHHPVHGGSLRMYAGPSAHYGDHSRQVVSWADQEAQRGMRDAATFEGFAGLVKSVRRNLRSLLHDLAGSGNSLAGYGAPAKGNTLLNYCDIGTDLLPFTVDRNPLKVGLLTPGMHLPVEPVEALLQEQPNYTLLLAWNFSEEIIRQQSLYREQGGKFLMPIPEPAVVSA